MGYSEFLKHQLGPENEYYEDIDEIYKAGSRAKEIVDQILPSAGGRPILPSTMWSTSTPSSGMP